jgi:hypothetical protein
MWNEILRFIQGQLHKIGYEAPVFIGFAVLLAQFASTLADGSPFKGPAQAAAGVLLTIGVLVGLARAFSRFFQYRPARGMVDGLAAGLVAGLVAGFLGYGWHSGPGYGPESSAIRAMFCTAFAVPIGGLLGFCFDLVHPDREFDWRKYLTGVVLSFGTLFLVAGASVVLFAPRMKGPGISVADLQLLFEVYVLTIGMMTCFYFACPPRVYARRAAILLASAVMVRLVTHLTPYDSNCQPFASTLAQMQFLIPSPECKERPEWLAIAVIGLMVWAFVTYAAMFRGQKAARTPPPPAAGIAVVVDDLVENG